MEQPDPRPVSVTVAAVEAGLTYLVAWVWAARLVAEEAALSADDELQLRQAHNRAAREELQRQIDEARERDESGEE